MKNNPAGFELVLERLSIINRTGIREKRDCNEDDSSLVLDIRTEREDLVEWCGDISIVLHPTYKVCMYH